MLLSAFSILLHGKVDGDGFVEQVLVVERLDRCVGRLEGIVRHEAVAFRFGCRGVACHLENEPKAKHGFFAATFHSKTHLWQAHDRSERRKGIEQHPFVDAWIKVANKEICSNVDLLPITAGLVDAQRFPIELDSVHDLASVVSILFGLELDKAVALMGLRDAVLGQMHVDNGPGLEHQFPDERIRGSLVDVAAVARRILVAIDFCRRPRHAV